MLHAVLSITKKKENRGEKTSVKKSSAHRDVDMFAQALKFSTIQSSHITFIYSLLLYNILL